MAPEHILYDLGGFIQEVDPFPTVQPQFTSTTVIGSGPIERDKSFSNMLGLVIDELQLTSLSFRGSDVVTLAWDVDVCVGLSIIQRDGAVGVDALTWIHPMVRHCGLGTAMKAHAIHEAMRAGVEQLRGNADVASIAFYGLLGIRPA